MEMGPRSLVGDGLGQKLLARLRLGGTPGVCTLPPSLGGGPGRSLLPGGPGTDSLPHFTDEAAEAQGGEGRPALIQWVSSPAGVRAPGDCRCLSELSTTPPHPRFPDEGTAGWRRAGPCRGLTGSWGQQSQGGGRALLLGPAAPPLGGCRQGWVARILASWRVGVWDQVEGRGRDRGR